MPPAAFLLVFISALAHVSWNLIGKRSQPSAAFFLMATLASGVFFSPFLWVYRSALAGFPASVWLLLLFTGFAQAFYYTNLAGAYRSGDLSLAYPLVRAVPVVLVAVGSIILGRGHQLNQVAIIGMGLVVAGCLLIPFQNFRLGSLKKVRNTTVFMALLAALGTTAYLLADDTALRLLKSQPGLPASQLAIPIIYIELETILTSFFLTLVVLAHRQERREWQWVKNNTWRQAVLSGLVITLGYLFVLTAMTLARDVSYVTAFRQISIPIGAALGIMLFKEPAYPPKISGIIIVFIGLIFVGLA